MAKISDIAVIAAIGFIVYIIYKFGKDIAGWFGQFKLPEFKLPEIKLPEIKLPEIKLPEIKDYAVGGVQFLSIPQFETLEQAQAWVSGLSQEQLGVLQIAYEKALAGFRARESIGATWDIPMMLYQGVLDISELEKLVVMPYGSILTG